MAVRRVKGVGLSSGHQMEGFRSSVQHYSPEATPARNITSSAPRRRFSIHLELQGTQFHVQYPQEWALSTQDELDLNNFLHDFARRPAVKSTPMSCSDAGSDAHIQKNEDIRIGYDMEELDVKPSSEGLFAASEATFALASFDPYKPEEASQDAVSGPESEMEMSMGETVEQDEYWRDYIGSMNLRFTDMDKVWRVMFSRLGGLPQTPCAAILKRLIDSITDHSQRRRFPFKSSAEDKGGTPPDWWPKAMLEWASPARMKVQEKKAAIAYIFMLRHWNPDFVEERLKEGGGSWKDVLTEAMKDVDLKTGYHRVGNDKAPTKRNKQQDKDDNTTIEELNDRRTLLDEMIGLADHVERVAQGSQDAGIFHHLHGVPRSLGRVMYGFGPGHSRPARNPDLTVSKKDFLGGPSQWSPTTTTSPSFDGARKRRDSRKSTSTRRRKPNDLPQATSARSKRARVEFPTRLQHDGCNDLLPPSQQQSLPDCYTGSNSQHIEGTAAASAAEEDDSTTSDETMTEADYDMQASAMPLTVDTNFASFTGADPLSGSQMSDLYSSHPMIASANTSFSSAGHDAGSTSMVVPGQVSGHLPLSAESRHQQARQPRAENSRGLPEHNERHGGAFIPEAAPSNCHFNDMVMTGGEGWLGPSIGTGQPLSAGFVGDVCGSGELYGMPPSSQASSTAYEIAMSQGPMYAPNIQQFYYVPAKPQPDRGFEAGGSDVRSGYWESEHTLKSGALEECTCQACQAHRQGSVQAQQMMSRGNAAPHG